MKNPTETLNELFASWEFSPISGIIVRPDNPHTWITNCLHYVYANMNEPENQDIMLLMHRFSAYALKHATNLDKVGFSAYLDNAITLTIDSMPANIQGLIEWTAFNHAFRVHYVDDLFSEDSFPDFRSLLFEAYIGWARTVLGHVKDYLLTIR